MPAGGELAALLARRAKVSGEDANGVVDDAVTVQDVSSSVPAAPPSPKSTVKPPHVSTPVRSDELKAVFEERNLEAGIPTPSFLVNARKNLKKPGSKEPPTISPVRGGTVTTCNYSNPKHTPACSSDNAIPSDAPLPPSGGGGTSSNSKRNNDIVARRSRINASRSSTSSVTSQASSSSENVGPAVTMAVSSLSGDSRISEGVTTNSRNNFGRADSDSASNQETIAARRSRINASRTTSSTSSALSTPSQPINKDSAVGQGDGKPKASPAQMRRQMMVSKIRTSRSNPPGGSENNSKQQQQQQQSNDSDSSVPRTAIISPKRDEFEVLFADDDFVSPGDESIDSIVKEMHDMHESLLNGSYSTAASTATMPTNNVHRHLMIDNTVIDTANPNTPEKSRIHNASTPKIRGNGNYKRENYDDIGMGGMRGSAFVGGTPSARQLQRGADAGSSHQYQSSPSHHSPKRRTNSLPLHQEQNQVATEDYLPHELSQKQTPHRTNLHDQLPQAYPFRQSPSQMSQMSAITTPSCFPQEYLIPGSAPPRLFGDLQQPLLINDTVRNRGSPIGLEKAGSALDAVGPSERLSAFSPRLEVENQRQREQLNTMAKKLEEKDAIISQLMKRISDLESMNASSARATTLEYHVNTEGLATPSSLSAAPHSSGARSNGSTGDQFAMSPVWEHSRPAPQWSNSDTESSCVPNPSPQHSQQQPSIQKQLSLQQHAQQRRGRSSLSTVTTSSTASVTTSNSSKSGRRSAPRSKSVSDSSRQSHKGDKGLGKKNKNDDRKFVC